MASPGELMASAVERTGLDDFGDDSFREGLEILVRALRDEARLNARGEGFIYARIGLHLRQRLQVEDWYRRHPEIDDVADRRPAVRAGPAPHRFHRAVVPARPGSRTSGTCAAGSRRSRARRRRPWSATIRESRPEQRATMAGTQASRARRHPRPDGVPRSHGARLQVADLPGVRADPVVLRMACRQADFTLDVRATSGAC